MNNLLIAAILIIGFLNVAFYVLHDAGHCAEADMKSTSIAHPNLRETLKSSVSVKPISIIDTVPDISKINIEEESFMPKHDMVGVDEFTRELFMQFIDEHESLYIACLNSIELYHVFGDCKLGASNSFSATLIFKRLQKLRLARHERLHTVQIGVMDGKSNDPLYKAYLQGKEPIFSMANWHSILVEPAFMQELKHTYETDVFVKSDVIKKNVHFVEGAFNEASKITADGYCYFYKVKSHIEGCPLNKIWAPQISTLDQRGLQKFFKKDYDLCVDQLKVSCWTMGTLLKHSGYDVELMTKTDGSGKVWCVDANGDRNNNKIDILVVDAEGYDGMIVHTTLKETCPQLWPSIILYEDKVMRFNSKKATNSTEGADSVIEFLEGSGYYCFLLGEDVLCLRVGYKLGDLRHSHFSKLRYKDRNWFHNAAVNYPITPENEVYLLKP